MPSDEDLQFGDNVRRYREYRGLSQAALAGQMTARGRRWYQSTVYKMEHGERPASGFEVRDLAEILRISADRLFWAGAEAGEITAADRASAVLRQSWEECATAVTRLLLDRDAAQRTLAAVRGSAHERVRAVASELAADLEDATLGKAVAGGQARYENPET